MAAISSLALPVRAQATCRRASVRHSSSAFASPARASSSSSAFVVGQNKKMLKKTVSTTYTKAHSRGGLTVNANVAIPTGDASPPPVVYNVSSGRGGGGAHLHIGTRLRAYRLNH